MVKKKLVSFADNNADGTTQHPTSNTELGVLCCNGNQPEVKRSSRIKRRAAGNGSILKNVVAVAPSIPELHSDEENE
jgi:hypothetical protein